MRFCPVLLCLLLLTACGPTSPAEYRAAAAGMERATADALLMLGQEAQYTEIARQNEARATEAAATNQVSAARATMEMAAAQRAANDAAANNDQATATAGALQTAVSYDATQVPVAQTRQAETQYHQENIANGLALLGAALALFTTGALVWLIYQLTKALSIGITARAEEKRANAMRAMLIETSKGLCYLNTKTGTIDPVIDYQEDDGPDQAAPSEVPSAAPAQVKQSPTMGELETFVRQAIAVVGRDAFFIPSDDAMQTSAALWSARTDRLAALGFIPRKSQGKRTTLYNGETLLHLLAHVIEYERAERNPPSPTEGMVLTVL